MSARCRTFDYVVVGAGSAGCVVAERLSRDSANSVALIEAGGNERRFWKSLPVGYGRLFHDPVANWRFNTEPCESLHNRPGYWPRGKGLGGSSAINALVWMRGLPSDWDRWQRLGIAGWSWADIAPFFDQIERTMAGPPKNDERAFPTDVTNQLHPLTQVFRSAADSLGLASDATLHNLSDGEGEGIGAYRIATRKGRRQCAYRAFIQPNRARANLTLLKHRIITSVKCDGRRAVGVLTSTGELISATKRVIVCAGAVASPSILQRSGIAAKELTQQLGIENLIELPMVGRNLQDHLAITYYYRSKRPTLNEQLHGWSGRLQAGLRYALRRDGPLSLSINQMGGLVRADANSDEVDTQLYITPASYSTADPKAKQVNFDPFPGLLVSAQPNRPHSRGSVEVISLDASTAPQITAPGMSDPRDEASAVAAVGFLARYLTTPDMEALIEAPLGPDARELIAQQALDDFRARAATVYHPVGSCSMSSDCTNGVVDASCSVWGMENLSVIDASVFPLIPSANTNAPIMALAAKAAEQLARREKA